MWCHETFNWYMRYQLPVIIEPVRTRVQLHAPFLTRSQISSIFCKSHKHQILFFWRAREFPYHWIPFWISFLKKKQWIQLRGFFVIWLFCRQLFFRKLFCRSYFIKNYWVLLWKNKRLHNSITMDINWIWIRSAILFYLVFFSVFSCYSTCVVLFLCDPYIHTYIRSYLPGKCINAVISSTRIQSLP